MGKYTRDAACEQLEREARDKLMAVQSTQFLFQKFMCKVREVIKNSFLFDIFLKWP